MSAAPLLVVEGLTAGYEPGVPIVRDVSLTVAPGEIVVVLGPNGAGKSSLVKAVAGLVPIGAGRVLLAGADVTRVPAHRRVSAGLAFVPQTENVFTLMSVEDNLKVAGDLLPRPVAARRVARIFEAFPDLARQRRLHAGRLSGGQRQMLAIGRALVVEPRILMLDEPSAGLSPRLVEQVFGHLAAIRKGGTTIVLVEQNARAALAIGDRAYVLAEGRNRHEGPAASLWGDPVIAQLYLGARKPAVAAAAP